VTAATLDRDGAVLLPRGRIADNIVHFVRVLRAAGLRVGPAHAIDAIAAAMTVGIDNREDFRAALAAVLVARHEDLALFEQAFDAYWRNPRLLERSLADALAGVQGRMPPGAPRPELAQRVADALRPRSADQRGDERPALDLDAALTFSPREVLQHKDFAAMRTDELAEVRRMLSQLRLPLPLLPVRRTEPALRGRSIDRRASLRRALGAAGAVAPLRFRRRVRRSPPLVVLCDISGSMDRYARMLLHFLHAITNDRDRVHVLLFGTRLTNITRHLRHKDVDVALAHVAGAVEDWAGGTRIGKCIAEFNRRWSRRLLGQNAVVLLISDGLDADAGAGLAQPMERLAKSARRVVWLNPLLRYPGFEARPAGIRAMLPFVDEFRPSHNFASLAALTQALDARRGRSGARDEGRRREGPGPLR
jgi:uncharacterized protein with von Willebrand factor type A (vWA) domain